MLLRVSFPAPHFIQSPPSPFLLFVSLALFLSPLLMLLFSAEIIKREQRLTCHWAYTRLVTEKWENNRGFENVSREKLRKCCAIYVEFLAMSQTELSRKVVKKRSSLLARAAHATSRSGKTRYNGGTEGAAATATGSSLGSQYGGGSGPRPARRALTASELALVREREEERAERERERIKRKRERRLDELERGLSSREKAASGSSKAAASSVAGAEAGGSGGVGGIGLPAASTSAATLAGILAGREAQRTSNTVIQDLPVPASTSATTAGGGGGSGVGGASPAASKRKQSAELRRIITHRKGFRALLDEAVGFTSASSSLPVAK